MAAFSRLQLAAALLEYDNDPETPELHKSAHDSAIFAHIRRNIGLRPKPAVSQAPSDYIDIALPREVESLSGRQSAVGSRKSRSSINVLRSMFGEQDFEEEDVESEEEEDVEVDLSSWGLDAFMPEDGDDRAARKKGKGRVLPNPHSEEGVQTRTGSINAARRPAGLRTRSLGNIDEMGLRDAFMDPEALERSRRASIASPLDLAGLPNEVAPFIQRESSHPAIVQIPSAPPLHSIPFPTGSTRSESPAQEDQADTRPASRFHQHERNTSINSRYLSQLEDARPVHHNRTYSNATMGTMATQLEDNPFALDPPTRSSKFDPKAAAHARTMSNVSLGSRLNPQSNDAASVMTTGQHRLSTTMELLRPKVLVMPSPLQNSTNEPAVVYQQPRPGFDSTTEGGPPLPPGARSARRSSVNLASMESLVPPVASNSFTPNPRSIMTLSQLTFRNNLVVGGYRDISYADLDSQIPRATEEGEQIQVYPPEEEEIVPQAPVEPEPFPVGRPAGKLYGKSLIDDLESRKLEMRSKQRVFTGDSRPSMMARNSSRSTTLIDPTSLQTRPITQRMGSYGSLERRNSTLKPLLNFEDDKSPTLPLSPSAAPRSVFGTDTLWEREVAKLREIEAAEALEAEKQRQIEEELEKSGRKNGKRSRKGNRDAAPPPETIPTEAQIPEPTSRLSETPPVLPAIQKASTRARPPLAQDESGSDSESSAEESRDKAAPDTRQWRDESDEEDDLPVRTTGVGPRHQKQRQSSQPVDVDSDEDMPLSASVARVLGRSTPLLRRPEASDSDEEKPLSVLLCKSPAGTNKGDDEDDQPLGLRASTAFPSFRSATGVDVDDDQPLAFHPEQQRRTQYQMLAQQQQQQQMMMQAQFQSSMYFAAPPAMMSGFFAPPLQTPMVMGPMLPMAPMSIPSPPPSHDAVKFGRVDQWRHDIAAEDD